MITSLLLLTALTMNSCQKCGTCKIFAITEISPPLKGYPYKVEIEKELCDEDYQSADRKIKYNENDSGGYTLMTYSKCNCY